MHTFTSLRIARRRALGLAGGTAVVLALATGGAAGVIGGSTVLTGEASAVTATVLNSFERVCSLGCGSFRQVNPPYNRSVGSVCTTYSRYGTRVSRYYLPAGRRCTP